MIKKFGKKILVKLLGRQVRRLTANKPELKVIAVSGSVGKTGTKLAIAHILGGELRVRYQDGNYNDILSVPLVFFGLKMPSIWNVLAWLMVVMKTESQLRRDYLYDVVVVELGTDHPGDLAEFSQYLNPDITVITAIAEEHMEFFGSLDEVAKEELEPVKYSKKVLLNISDINEKYIPEGDNIITYGLSKLADNRVVIGSLRDGLHRLVLIELADQKALEVNLPTPSRASAKSVLAAAVVAKQLGLKTENIKKRFESLPGVPGRMQVLRGVNDSLILDDTYNSSPVAAAAALKLLYEIKAERRIAILGSMNELGSFSKNAHEKVGKLCDPSKLDLVVTIGNDAFRFLAPAAMKAGCQVERFLNPVAAGKFVQDKIKPGTVILAKGSQNGVFAEEATKILLASPTDKSKLVRQSKAWLKIKHRQFPEVKV